jgi:hypothetical protein
VILGDPIYENRKWSFKDPLMLNHGGQLKDHLEDVLTKYRKWTLEDAITVKSIWKLEDPHKINTEVIIPGFFWPMTESDLWGYSLWKPKVIHWGSSDV